MESSCLVLACLQRDGRQKRRGCGGESKGRYMGKKTKREGGSSWAYRLVKFFSVFTRCWGSVFLYVYGVLAGMGHGVRLVR